MMSEKTAAFLSELASGRIPRGSIPEDLDNVEQTKMIVSYLTTIQQFSIALANGDLSAPLPSVGGPVAGSLKSLHASLKHLTWQAKQIAGGDFTQRVDFMGEFSDAFNIMVERLETSRNELEAMNLKLQEDNIKLRNLTEALRESEERFRHIAENVSDVIWTLDRSLERFTYISPSIAQLRGLTVEEALQEPISEAMTPESLDHMRKILSDKISAIENGAKEDPVSEIIEVEQLCRSGRTIHVEVVISAVTDAEGRLKEFVGISRDISVRKRAETRLKYQSTHDSSTGLYNRAFFDEELERMINGSKFPVSIVVADLDGLKRVNDSLGHEVGDQLIKGAAEILQMAFRGNDIVARTGGDEFVILLPEVDWHGAMNSIERIRNCMQAYNSENEGPLVSISLGAATAASGGEIVSALKEADEQMYADKIKRKQQRME
jgi:diguanylate cyclase (GGDEF)-like protein/PAS domain S-box-containing protein